MKKALFALMAIAILMLVACVPKEKTTEPTGPVTPPVTQAPAVKEPTTTVPSAPATPSALTNPFIDASCVGETIKITIANVQDKAWTLGDNMKIYLNAGIDAAPGCEKEVLEPGESMTCDQIDWPKVFPTRENVVQIVADGERFTVKAIMCTAAAE